MSANEAYQIATQWLVAIDMDVDSLEKKYGSRLKIEPRFYLALANEVKDELLNRPNYARDYSLSATNKVMLPIWQVMWPGGAEVQVLGFSKELIKLECLDPSLSRRKPLIFPNVAEIEKYSALQTNLPVLHLQRPTSKEP